MTVATFEQPNYLTQSAAAYKAAIDAAIAVLQSIGGDFAPHASTAANMQVVIDAGRIFKPGGAMVSVSQQTTGALIAPVSNPRIDRIVVDSEDGIYSVITGTEAASPTAPAIPNGKLPVCQIAMTVAMTTIANSIITDERTTYSPLARLIRIPVEQVISATGGFVREILLSDRGILFDCDCSNGPVTILLPDTASAGNGFTIGVIKSDSTANEIVLTPSTTGEAFPDGTTKTIGSQNGAGIVTTDGLGQWYLAFDSSRTYNNVTLTGATTAEELTIAGLEVATVLGYASNTSTSLLVTASFSSVLNLEVGDLVMVTYLATCSRNGADFYINGSFTFNGTCVIDSSGLTDGGLPLAILGVAIHGSQRINTAISSIRKVTSAGTLISVGLSGYTTVGTAPVADDSFIAVTALRAKLV